MTKVKVLATVRTGVAKCVVSVKCSRGFEISIKILSLKITINLYNWIGALLFTHCFNYCF